MKIKRMIFWFVSLLFTLIIVSFSFSYAQENYSYNDKAIYFSGYEKDIKGEVLGYHSPLPSVNSSLLVRSISRQNYIEWETGKIPSDYKEQYSSFVWMYGIQAKPETHKFDLFINDKYILSFNNPKDTVTRTITIEGTDSIMLTFDATMVDKNDDLMGFACLKVPTALYPKGKALRIKIEGESLTRNTWYMTFRHSINNNIRSFQQSVVVKSKPVNLQPVIVEIMHFANPAKGKIKLLGKEYDVDLKKGFNKYNLSVPAATRGDDVEVSYSINNNFMGKTVLHIEPVKDLTIYLLHHSHNDIGYTHVQSDVVKMQIKNLKDAISAIKNSENYPLNSRMKWNSEVVWPVLQYLRNCTKEEIVKLKNAVKEGSIEINALYGNMLTGLCRPEELMNMLEPGRKIAEEFGIKNTSAMISDVPGLSWGIVPVLANYGIKYLQIGENTGDRIGHTLSTWGDKPFYWVSPSGKDKILCFTAGKGYSFFHTGLNYTKFVNPLKEERLSYYLEELDKEQYPYDIIPVHYTVGSDNGPVHMDLPAIIKEWNNKYVTPKIIVATATEFFKVFEEKYGNKVPVMKGDYTGSWDDGAASTAFETGMNRRSADRITQAEALYAITNKKVYPEKEFSDAWENVLLYSEHTWGSWNSMSDPENPFTKQQWAVKKSFAVKADSISKKLVGNIITAAVNNADAIDVYNTSSWNRSGWVILDEKTDMINKDISDGKGNIVPYQVLKDYRLAIFVKDIPALGAKRYYKIPKAVNLEDKVHFKDNILSNDLISVEINKETGDISSLMINGVKHNFVDNTKFSGLTNYQYVNGRRPDKTEGVSNVKIVKGVDGPYIKSIKVISDAAGCNRLEKEITIYYGIRKVDISITVDRKKVYTPEGIHIAFPFNVPEAINYVNTAWATFRPEYEQLKGSCKNYFPVQRFVDVSNQRLGITLVTIDAPMVEIGEIMTDANVFGWKKHIENSPLIYSYIMNNYWGTNYKAEQEGITKFSYSLYPHLRHDLSESEIKSIEESQPLVAAPVKKDSKQYPSLFRLSSDKIIITSIKPNRDRKGIIVRLFNTSAQPAKTSFKWGAFKASKIYLTGPDEKRLNPVSNNIEMLSNDIITLKLEK